MRLHRRSGPNAVSLTACLALLCATSHAQQNARFDFQGKLLVVACDTDMLASAYVDGKLGPALGPDVLSVIRLAPTPKQMKVATVAVTNSVTGPPAAVAVTPDGHYAIVVETQGPRPLNKPYATMKDLALGKKITVVDLHDPNKPAVTQQIESHERAVSVAINAAGTLVAVAFSPKGHVAPVPLSIFRFRAGRLSTVAEPKLPGFAAEDEVNDIEFLPGKDVLAVVYASKPHPRLSLLRFELQGDTFVLKPWGNDTKLDASPFLVRFTSGGRFAVVNSMALDANFRGTVTSIQIASATNADGSPQHSIVSHVEAGELPEGLAISPDGRWVATANLEESYEPLTDPKQQFFASLSLFRLDSSTGRLERVGEFPFDGVLPEPIVFDNSSRFIAAPSFQRYDNAQAGGAIHFWRIAEHNRQPGRTELIELDESVTVARGPQSLAIVR